MRPEVEGIRANWMGGESQEYWQTDLTVREVPSADVEVEVHIDDNGHHCEGRFIAGLIGAQWEQTGPHIDHSSSGSQENRKNCVFV